MPDRPLLRSGARLAVLPVRTHETVGDVIAAIIRQSHLEAARLTVVVRVFRQVVDQNLHRHRSSALGPDSYFELVRVAAGTCTIRQFSPAAIRHWTDGCNCPPLSTCPAEARKGKSYQRYLRRNLDQDLFEDVQAGMREPTFGEKLSERTWKMEGLFTEAKAEPQVQRPHRHRHRVQPRRMRRATVLAT